MGLLGEQQGRLDPSLSEGFRRAAALLAPLLHMPGLTAYARTSLLGAVSRRCSPRDFPARPGPAHAARCWDPCARSVLAGSGAQAQRVAARRRSRPSPRALTSRSLVPAVAAAATAAAAVASAAAIGVEHSSGRRVPARRPPRAASAAAAAARPAPGEEAAGPGPRERG